MAPHGHAQSPHPVSRSHRRPPRSSRPHPLLRHQLAELPTRPLESWGKFRWQDNALSALWLYQRQPDPSLLNLVRLLHQQGWDWQQQYARFTTTDPVTREIIKQRDTTTKGDFSLSTHGVNNGQAIKAAPVWSLVSGVPEDRAGIYTMLSALDRYHGLPNGMFSCDEHLAGRNPSQGSELCTVVETMFSLEQSIAILADPTLADRLERIAFNALPGAFSPDMWAHQYNQEPNQVECSLHRKPWTTDGPESNLYGLAPHFGCCTANYHQGWPKFTASLFMQVPADPTTGTSEGLAAIAYAPCTVRTSIRNTPVECIQTTDYPFRNSIRIVLNPAHPIAFPLHIRIPSWATNAELRINNQPQPQPASATFARLHRTWTRGDTIDLSFPQTPILVPGFNNSVSVERGPLVFSLPIGESWVKLRDQHLTADWQVFPTTPWNYALTTDTSTPIPVTENPIPANPFTQTPAPAVSLAVTAPPARQLACPRRCRRPRPSQPGHLHQPRTNPPPHPLRSRQAAHHRLPHHHQTTIPTRRPLDGHDEFATTCSTTTSASVSSTSASVVPSHHHKFVILSAGSRSLRAGVEGPAHTSGTRHTAQTLLTRPPTTPPYGFNSPSYFAAVIFACTAAIASAVGAPMVITPSKKYPVSQLLLSPPIPRMIAPSIFIG